MNKRSYNGLTRLIILTLLLGLPVLCRNYGGQAPEGSILYYPGNHLFAG